MASGQDQEKTERATPKKRQEARDKGNVARSKEIPSVAILMGALGVFFFGGTWIHTRMIGLMRGVFSSVDVGHLDGQMLHALIARLMAEVALILLPIFAVVILAGVVANVSQVGWMITTKVFKPNLGKLNPLKGMKRFVSIKSLVELVKSVFKLVLVASVSYFFVKGDIKTIPTLTQMPLVDIMGFLFDVAFKIAFYTCLAMIVLAVIDLVYQRWQHEKDLRMTKQEVKDEYKQREGDPKVKSRIRSMQIERLRQHMMENIPEATVVITNPTHLAIAIKFEAQKMFAPAVVAKGAGHVAERIKTIARQHDVPIVENKPLARTLYKAVELGDFIPYELYQAVAEVLAYVYRLQGMFENGQSH